VKLAVTYIVLNNVLLKNGNITSQIDHIIISIYGLFIIETKNYTGWIFGDDNSEYWTQVNYKFKSRFRNPVKQNWSHVFVLKNILSDLKSIQYYPIVIFAGGAELKKIKSSMPVTYVELLHQTIIDKSQIQSLNWDEMNKIQNMLLNYTIENTNKNKNEHISNIQENINKRINNNSTLICPKCGNALVPREGRYGRFLGCSNYPSCRYTRKYH